MKNRKILITLSPGFSCWECERPLPQEPWGVRTSVTGEDAESVLLATWVVCSPQCQRPVIEEILGQGIESDALNPRELRAVLDQPGYELMVMQGKRVAGGMCMSFYGYDISSHRRESLLRSMRAANN